MSLSTEGVKPTFFELKSNISGCILSTDSKNFASGGDSDAHDQGLQYSPCLCVAVTVATAAPGGRSSASVAQ
ncbi:hypothetical protein E2C01_071300 [Portunus trituberculatus]|uniref:Uncharacterized protein n=1 Tax=Portunus trituberculatus TaxID=210409 RepID=A0A5B7I5V1_PORTR|nr:hypothetical protein [Portunus trituberculatus]